MIEHPEWVEAPFAIKIHIIVALTAMLTGAVALSARKGSALHRTVGRGFVLAACLTALTSFFIHEIELWGIWSPIHLLSLFTLAMLARGVSAVRKGHIDRHQAAMRFLYVSGFVVATGFTLLPDRLLGEVFVVPLLAELPGMTPDQAIRTAKAAPAVGFLLASYLYRDWIRRVFGRRWRIS